MQLHLRSVGVTGLCVEWSSALKGIELNCIALHSRELNCVQLILARWIAVREEVEILHGLMIIRDLRIVAFSVLTHTKLY